MNDCTSILQRLSQYLDGALPETTLADLQRQVQARPECKSMFDAMLWVHESLEAAPMLEPSRDFSVSVAKELAWRQRRDKVVLAGVLALATLTMIAPLLALIWAGLVAWLEPGIFAAAISWLIEMIGNAATYSVALFALIQHLPQWAIISFSTFVSLSFLLLALAIAMQKSPELLFASSSSPHKQTA